LFFQPPAQLDDNISPKEQEEGFVCLALASPFPRRTLSLSPQICIIFDPDRFTPPTFFFVCCFLGTVFLYFHPHNFIVLQHSALPSARPPPPQQQLSILFEGKKHNFASTGPLSNIFLACFFLLLFFLFGVVRGDTKLPRLAYVPDMFSARRAK
jgi:hypothetical protein